MKDFLGIMALSIFGFMLCLAGMFIPFFLLGLANLSERKTRGDLS